MGDGGYQTTTLSTFRHQPDTSCSSAESSCSALNDKQCQNMQVTLEVFQIEFLVKTQGNKEQPFSLSCKLQFSFVNITFNPDNFQTMMLQTPKRRVLNTYSSLPRPGQTFGSPMMGWRYADQSEVASHTLISRRAPEGGPEYANLIPWSVDNPRVHRSQPPPPTPPRVAHYATLGRAPASKTKISKVTLAFIWANISVKVLLFSVKSMKTPGGWALVTPFLISSKLQMPRQICLSMSYQTWKQTLLILNLLKKRRFVLN